MTVQYFKNKTKLKIILLFLEFLLDGYLPFGIYYNNDCPTICICASL